MKSLAGIGVIWSLFSSAFVGLIYLLTPSLLFLGLLPAFYSSVVRLVAWMWFNLAAFLLEFVCRIQIRVFASDSSAQYLNKLEPRASWIVIANHRTRLDWMFMWCLFARMQRLTTLRIILKDSLRAIPFAGWAMQHFRFIFLKRSWAHDEEYMTKHLQLLGEAPEPSTLLLFPEGTDLSESNVEKSNQFAFNQNLPTRKYSLYPRTKGFHHIYHHFHQAIDSVIDITLFYVDHVPGERPNEKSLLTGRFPRAITFYIDRVSVQEVPQDEKHNKIWLEKRFQAKEQMLERFYQYNELPENSVPLYTSTPLYLYFLPLLCWLLVILIILQVGWKQPLLSLVYIIVTCLFYMVIMKQDKPLELRILETLVGSK